MKIKIWIILIMFIIFCAYSIANYYKDEGSEIEIAMDENLPYRFCISEENTNKIVCVNITKGEIKETTYELEMEIVVINSRPVIWVTDVEEEDAIIFIKELRCEDDRIVSRIIDRNSQIDISSIKPTNYSIDQSLLDRPGFVGIYIEF